MGGDDHRGAVLGRKTRQQVDDLLAGGRVEIAGRLVREHDARIDGGARGPPDALLLATRELAGQVLGALRQADLGQELERTLPPASPPAGISFASTFSTAVSVGIRLNCWKTKPNERNRIAASSRSGSSDRSRPSKTSVPELGRSSVPSSCSSVVLPEPLGPFERQELACADLEVDAVERPDHASARA